MSGCRPTIVWVVKARERQTTLLFVRLYRQLHLTHPCLRQFWLVSVISPTNYCSGPFNPTFTLLFLGYYDRYDLLCLHSNQQQNE